MDVNKDAVFVVVGSKIGLVYTHGMPSKEAVLAGIYRKCGNSLTLNVNINKLIHISEQLLICSQVFEKNEIMGI